MPAQKGLQKLAVNADGEKITVYTGARVKAAFKEVYDKCDDLYHGVRLMQVIQAFYEQGKKDGRREMIEKMDALKIGVRYLPPGPRKKRPKKSN
jgi:hypothetical protein